MTAPRTLAAAIAVMVMLVTGTGCEAPLATDRESKPDAQASGEPSPTPAPTMSTTPRSPDSSQSADGVAAEAKTREARRKAALAAQRAAGPVVAISVDGLNPVALTQLGPARLPQLHTLVRGGASTLNARTALEMTLTLPNHTGMLTGRPVEGPSGHHVDFNEDPGRVTVSSHAGRTIASVFNAVHVAGRSSALYASKTKFEVYERSWGGSIDSTVIDEDNDRLVGRLVSVLTTRPADFTFVHLSAPDVAGHDSGFMGPAYLRAVQQVDRLIGRIRAAVAAAPLAGGPTSSSRPTTAVAARTDTPPREIRTTTASRSSSSGRVSGPEATSTLSIRTTATRAAAARRTPERSRSATATSPPWRPGCSASPAYRAASSGSATRWT